ncbi:bef235d5-74a7-4929-b147-c05db96e6cc5-CDS [Sclerotinia trifoliorum]|uniref:Bef235d5-74a7-4929-b147-c05db96e6cc5-CDS n=1 Tax=Sclerotinia trifoliorum TaxID=28548 RepID=A0A8H2VYZ2_9HELO|nr:bef235d5-74a7-4929-b147-c05db96e6cc5-CDS [Sclerotinia trifoliorum]
MVAQENITADIQGAMLGSDNVLDMDHKGSLVHTVSRERHPNIGIETEAAIVHAEGHGHDHIDPDLIPTEEEKKTLRKVAGKLPTITYLICAVEFAERASYYGCNGLFNNYVNRPLPVGGDGYGAPPRGTEQTAGALGLGTVKATATSQSFSMLAYALPLFFGWLADTKTGRFKIICWGVAVCGIAHILMCASGAPSLLASGGAKAPFFLSVYTLSIGAAMFKPNIAPTLLDQMPNAVPVKKTLASGEVVIVDPESTTERVMLWFYLLVNIGGFMGVPTAYTEKYIGWWLSFLLPLLLYVPLPFLLWYMRKRLILYPPGGSDLANVCRVVGICFKRGGLRKIFTRKGGFFEPAKPSNIAKSGNVIQVPWNDGFIEDVKRTFEAAGIFCFFPIQNINDNGLGSSASALSTMLTTRGAPNDVMNNFNSLSIIMVAPMLNYGLYPFLRARNIHYGPIARMTTGFFLSTLGGAAYTVLNYYAYKIGPCGKHGSSESCVDANGVSLVSSISVWYMAIPYAIGGISELFVNVPAYGIAYSRAPANMRGLVSALNLFTQAIAYALGLACAGVIKDPYLTWDFGAPTIIGAIMMVIFYWLYRDIDKEEYTLSQNDEQMHVADAPIDGQSTSEKTSPPSYEGEKRGIRDTKTELEG